MGSPIADLVTSGTAARMDLRGPGRRLRGADRGRPARVPAQVPQDGGGPVRVLPRLGGPVLRRRRAARGSVGRRALGPRLDPGRPARGELRHLHGLRPGSSSSTSTTSTRPTSATTPGTCSGWPRASRCWVRLRALRPDDRADDRHLRPRLRRAGARVRDRRPRRGLPAHARDHRRPAARLPPGRARRTRASTCSSPPTTLEGHVRRFADGPGVRRLDDDEREAVLEAYGATSTPSPSPSASRASPTTSRTSSGAGASGSAARACPPTTCSSRAAPRRSTTTSCCR